MNKSWVLFHLAEAQEELEKTIKEIESDPEYDSVEYSIAMSHLYNHINTAWNSQNSTETEESNDNNFEKWRQFPTNIDMSC